MALPKKETIIIKLINAGEMLQPKKLFKNLQRHPTLDTSEGKVMNVSANCFFVETPACLPPAVHTLKIMVLV